MYKPVKTHGKFTTLYGSEFKPIATLKDEHGGICHVTVDDDCYIPFLHIQDSGFVPTHHIFPELHDLMCKLPTLEVA